MIWLIVPIGIGIATIAMFTGIGGGVLWMPVLISVYKMRPEEAVACALIIQTAGMASGTWANWRRRRIAGALLKQQLAVAGPAVVLGAALCRASIPAFIELSLGLLIFTIAYMFLRGDELWNTGGREPDLEAGRDIRPVTAIGGFLTGFLSVGAGDWLVPLFNRKCGLTMARSIATGIALMMFLSGLGAMAHLALGGSVPWKLIGAAIPGVVIGGQLGSQMHERFSEHGLKEVFVLLLLTLAAHVTFNAI